MINCLSCNFDANIGESIEKTNKNEKKMSFFLKKSVYYLVFVLKNGYFS